MSLNLTLEDIIEWDVFNWSKALDFWRLQLPHKNTNPNILTLGERNGGLSLWLALEGYSVIYSDKGGPNEHAIDLHKKYSVQNLIQYRDIDVFKMPFDDNSFDVVLCKSVIGGLKLVYKDRRTRTLENQKIACNEIRRILKPNGVFLGAENMQGSKLHQWYRKYNHLDIGWRHLKINELNFLFSDYSHLETSFFGFLPSTMRIPTFNKIAYQMNKLLCPILKKEWQYIGFIAARK